MKFIEKLKKLFSSETVVSQDKSTHVSYLVFLILFLVLPFFISYSSEVGKTPSLFSISLPPTCMSRELFSLECPGCGMTRSFVLLTHGQFSESLAIHRMGLLLYLFFIYLVVFRIYCIRNPGKEFNPFFARLHSLLPYGMILLLLVNWFAGIYLGGN